MGLAAKLRERRKVFGTMISTITWTGIVPHLKKGRLDFAVFEYEHSHYTWHDLEALLRTANMVDLPAIVRVTDIAYHQISKVLDLGADGVLIPRIESLEQMHRVIDMVRLPPKGKKGVGGYDFSRGELQQKLADYNTEKMIFLQIESPEGIESLDAMLATGEAAAVLVGPFDLSVSMGIPGQFDHPEFTAAVGEVIRICGKHAMSCGMFMDGDEEIRRWRKAGMNIIWSGSDLGFLLDGFRRKSEFIAGLE